MPKNNTSHSPRSWQQIAYWSIFPAIILAPAWLAVGRSLFGVGGWGTLLTMFIAVIFFLPFQLLVLVLVKMAKQKYLSKWASGLVFAYYIILVINQISFVDGSDAPEDRGSVLTFMGVPSAVNQVLLTGSIVLVLVVMAALIGVLIRDLVRSKRTV
ncbi:MAG TPA: hypothetical protein VIM37_03780 [Candidatus Microsaccharimonas sp.]|jgi:hypothetical protein